MIPGYLENSHIQTGHCATHTHILFVSELCAHTDYKKK